MFMKTGPGGQGGGGLAPDDLIQQQNTEHLVTQSALKLLRQDGQQVIDNNF